MGKEYDDKYLHSGRRIKLDNCRHLTISIDYCLQDMYSWQMRDTQTIKQKRMKKEEERNERTGNTPSSPLSLSRSLC